MRETTKKLSDYIESFLNGTIDGVAFEKAYSDCYDFEELETGENFEYLQNVRTLLERFSPYEVDLKEHPDYYINEDKLKRKINVFKIMRFRGPLS